MARSRGNGVLPEQQGSRLFKPGQSGNPAGRPKGARNKVSEQFLQAIAADFERNGAEAIRACRERDPTAYVRVVAGLLPKEVKVETRRLEEMSTDELLAVLREDEDQDGAEALH